VDIDATIVIAHSEKDEPHRRGRRRSGITRSLLSLITVPPGPGSHWPWCCGPGNAGSNTAADHIEATKLALAQLPAARRRQVPIRTDSAGGTQEFLAWLTKPGRGLQYSAGFTITSDVQDAILKIPATAWTPAYDGDGRPRKDIPGA
jgi:hypothetical protein